MTLEITIVQTMIGNWIATYEENIPEPAVADGNTPEEAMAALAKIINYEDIPS